MYKYTPDPAVLAELNVPRVGEWWTTAYMKRLELLDRYGIKFSYAFQFALGYDYHLVKHFSTERLDLVPVRGHMFPAVMFIEEEC